MARLLGDYSGKPQMRAAFSGWTLPIVLEVYRDKVVDDGLVKTTKTLVKFNGTIQPLSARQIALKPEGQRAWEWLMIHAMTSKRDLEPNDRIQYNGVIYKVMGSTDYSNNNYIQYDVIKDYTQAPGCA